MASLKAILILPLIVLFVTGFAQADDKLAPNPAKLERLLKDWEKQSARLKTLEVSIYRIDRDPNSNEQHFEGHAAFKDANLAYLDWKRVKLVPDDNEKMVPQLDTGKRRVSTPLETIIWSGEELWQYHYDTKKVVIFRLDKVLRLPALESGPLPLVFNVRADDARKRYDMMLLDEEPKQHLLKLTPKRQKDREIFSTAWIILDPKSFLPRRILLLSPDEKSSQDFTLSQFQVNQPVNESFFRGIVRESPGRLSDIRVVKRTSRPNDQPLGVNPTGKAWHRWRRTPIGLDDDAGERHRRCGSVSKVDPVAE